MMRAPFSIVLVVSLFVCCEMLAQSKAIDLLILNSGLELAAPEPPTNGNDGTDDRADGVGGGGVRKRQAPAYDGGPWADDTPAMIENKLNQLRRTVAASNMNYANWNTDLSDNAASLVIACRLQTESAIDPSKFPYAEGMTGIVRSQSTVSSQLQAAFNMGVAQRFYRQLMSSRMTHVGCAVSSQICMAFDPQIREPFVAKIFACIFSYKSDPNAIPVYKAGLNCSSCDNDTLWCDGGLCRGSCDLYNPTCDTCQDTCSDCSRVVSGGSDTQCQCVCYYGNDSPSRCQNVAGSSESWPVCTAKPEIEYNYMSSMPVGWIACIIISSALLLSLAISVAIWHAFRRRRWLRQQERIQRDGGHTNAANVYDEFGPNFVPVMSPPPYIDAAAKPPPYEPAAEKSDDSAAPQLPSAPSSDDKSADGSSSVVPTETHIYDNVVCTGDDTLA